MIKARLTQTGKRNSHSYRIIISETRRKRDGDYIDLLGIYNPTQNPALFTLNQDKLQDWVQKGAQISTGLHRILTEQKITIPTPKKTVTKTKTPSKKSTPKPAPKKAAAKTTKKAATK